MYRRTAWNPPFRLLANSFWISKSREHGRTGAAKELVFSRNISTTKKSTPQSMQLQIVDALRIGERSKASSLLLSLTEGNYSLKANDFVSILKYCACSPDPVFVMETWRVMEENQISLDNVSSLLMIRALCKGGYMDEAFNMINFLGESQGIYPRLPIYNSFLDSCAEMQSIDHANQCLDLMDHRMVGKNEVTYSQLLKFAVWQKNLSAVQEIWNEYIMKYSINILPLRRFIWSFTRLGDLKSAYEALQKMIILVIKGSSSIHMIAEGKLRSSRVDIPIPSKHILGLKQLDFSKLNNNSSSEDQGTPFSIRSREPEIVQSRRTVNIYKSEPVMKLLGQAFNDVIHACGYLKNYSLAERLIAQMQKLGLNLTSNIYDGYVKTIVFERGFYGGMDVLKIMQRINLKVQDRTLATLSLSCSKALELDLAEAMLHQISEYPYAHPFNVFFAACDVMDQPERAIRVLAKMRRIELLPDTKTYEVLFSLFGKVNAGYEKSNEFSRADVARRIKALEMDMAKNGIQHSHLSMENLLRALGAEKMIREMIHYLHMAESLFSRKGTYLGIPIYNAVLHSLVAAKESRMAIEMFKSMKSCGMSPDDATYNIMIDCCSILRCFRSATGLLSMMIRSGFHPNTLTFTILVKIQLQNGNFDAALGLLDQASLEGVKFDVVLFNTILKEASEQGMIDVIEFVVELMHQENIKPSAATCEYVFSAYVKHGFYSTAMEALQVFSMRMLRQKYGRRVWDNLVLAEDEEAESRILQHFEYFEGHAVALLSLRWSAMLGYSISWSPDLSPWAKRLSTTYGTKE